MNKEKDRFDLEQEIMECWRVVDDLRLFYEKEDEMTKDQKMNMLLGMIEMYELKFDRMFRTFEQSIRKGEFLDEKYSSATNSWMSSDDILGRPRTMSSDEYNLNKEYADDLARKFGAVE